MDYVEWSTVCSQRVRNGARRDWAQEGECSELRTMYGDQDVWSERGVGIVGRREKGGRRA